jgi:hypothetical protein
MFWNTEAKPCVYRLLFMLLCLNKAEDHYLFSVVLMIRILFECIENVILKSIPEKIKQLSA